jgi:hypothetical protein
MMLSRLMQVSAIRWAIALRAPRKVLLERGDLGEQRVGLLTRPMSEPRRTAIAREADRLPMRFYESRALQPLIQTVFRRFAEDGRVHRNDG